MKKYIFPDRDRDQLKVWLPFWLSLSGQLCTSFLEWWRYRPISFSYCLLIFQTFDLILNQSSWSFRPWNTKISQIEFIEVGGIFSLFTSLFCSCKQNSALMNFLLWLICYFFPQSCLHRLQSAYQHLQNCRISIFYGFCLGALVLAFLFLEGWKSVFDVPILR